jgi:aminoglycoside phosphotransferase family enzyme
VGPFAVSALQLPGAYPHAVGNITIIETHLSWVALTGDYAYKVKKPVVLPFADFSDIERRRLCCEKELMLNIRCSPDIYLEVVPINGGRQMRIGGVGPVVEYALKMRQLPQMSRLDIMLKNGVVSLKMIVALADHVFDFHNKAAVADDPHFASPDTICSHINSFDHLKPAVDKVIDREEIYDQILARCNAFLRRNRRVFDGSGVRAFSRNRDA